MTKLPQTFWPGRKFLRLLLIRTTEQLKVIAKSTENAVFFLKSCLVSLEHATSHTFGFSVLSGLAVGI